MRQNLGLMRLAMGAIALGQSIIASAVCAAPDATSILPATTPGLVLIQSTPQAWLEVAQVSSPSQVRRWLKLPFLPPAIDVLQDVAPWVGERVAIALLPAQSEQDTFETTTVLIAPIRAAQRLQPLLDKLVQLRGQPQIEQDYSGITIRQWLPPEPPSDELPDERPEESPEHTAPSPDEPPAAPSAPEPDASSLRPRASWGTNWRLRDGVGINRFQLRQPRLQLPSSPAASPELPAPPQAFAIAQLPGFLVVARRAAAIEALIDAQRGLTPLTTLPRFRQTLAQPPSARSLLLGYANMATAAQTFTRLARSLDEGALPGMVGLPRLDAAQLHALTQDYDTIALRGWLQPNRLQVQVRAYYPAPKPTLEGVAPSAQLLAQVPAVSYLVWNGHDLRQQWAELQVGSRQRRPESWFSRLLRQTVQRLLGLNLATDVAPLIDGEYAVFVYAARGGLFNTLVPHLNMEMGILAQTRDRAKLEQTLNRSIRVLRSRLRGSTIARRMVNGRLVSSVETRNDTQSSSLLAHTWLTDQTLMITTGAEAMPGLLPQPYLALPQNPTFRTAIAGLPDANAGYFYVNVGASLSLLSQVLRAYLPPRYQPFIQTLQSQMGQVRSISSTRSATAAYQQLDVRVVLGNLSP